MASLLDVLIFDVVYGSRILSLLLFTLGAMYYSWTYQCPPLCPEYLSSSLTMKSVDLVVATDCFLCVMEIIHSFHSG